jgi:hypothetical protein
MRAEKLERLFARLVAASVPVCVVAGATACNANSGTPCGVASCCSPFLVMLDGALPDANAFLDAGSTYSPLGFDGGLTQGECAVLCGGYVWGCGIVSEGPPAVVTCQWDCSGRRPVGLRAETPYAGSPLGFYFASMTQHEAASVPAFRRMARELKRFGAPRRLVHAAERAARDEIRHARAAEALARRFGARIAGFEVDADGPRSLEDLAIENAVEGCVRETYGALVATWQARTAPDPRVRAHMTRIARDETAHAALAWKTHVWARARLDRAGRARVEAARTEALRELIETVARTEPEAELVTVAGVPRGAIAGELARGLVGAIHGQSSHPSPTPP